jgi:hypothetical protein
MKVTNTGLIVGWIVVAIGAAIWAWPVNPALSLLLGLGIVAALLSLFVFPEEQGLVMHPLPQLDDWLVGCDEYTPNLGEPGELCCNCWLSEAAHTASALAPAQPEEPKWDTGQESTRPTAGQ